MEHLLLLTDVKDLMMRYHKNKSFLVLELILDNQKQYQLKDLIQHLNQQLKEFGTNNHVFY